VRPFYLPGEDPYDSCIVAGYREVKAMKTNAKLDKANLIITAKTLIFKEQDGKRVRQHLRILRLGS